MWGFTSYLRNKSIQFSINEKKNEENFLNRLLSFKVIVIALI